MTSPNKSPTERKKRSPQPQPPAPDKVQAVLAVWTERCKPAEVCRQLNINWVTFNQWQQRAMEGMLQALESRVNLSKGEALSPRLQTLLQNRQQSHTASRLTARLRQINKVAKTPPVPAQPQQMNPKARQRAEVLFKVRSGQMTATQAAQTLSISRQQYYQWEQRALQALLTALTDQPTGRPKTPSDPEKEALQRRVQQLEQQVQRYEEKEQLRQLLNSWAARDDLPPAKKNSK